jgi:hypothetical protein
MVPRPQAHNRCEKLQGCPWHPVPNTAKIVVVMPKRLFGTLARCFWLRGARHYDFLAGLWEAVSSLQHAACCRDGVHHECLGQG